jgi:hypothetical protein
MGQVASLTRMLVVILPNHSQEVSDLDVADTTQNSNIVRFFQLLKKDDRDKQMVRYLCA